jgi:hypothetical protein
MLFVGGSRAGVWGIIIYMETLPLDAIQGGEPFWRAGSMCFSKMPVGFMVEDDWE